MEDLKERHKLTLEKARFMLQSYSSMPEPGLKDYLYEHASLILMPNENQVNSYI
jgi:hypothetical protein